MKPIIALTGFIGSGKTTAAKALYGIGYQRIRFAGPLKDMLRSLGLTDEHLDGKLKEDPTDLLCGKSPRWAMQKLGAEWGRDLIHPELWINQWKRRVNECKSPVVCDDLRYPNEADAVRSVGGVIIYIDRKGIGRSYDHSSEHMINDIIPDRVVPNHGTEEEFRAYIRDYGLTIKRTYA